VRRARVQDHVRAPVLTDPGAIGPGRERFRRAPRRNSKPGTIKNLRAHSGGLSRHRLALRSVPRSCPERRRPPRPARCLDTTSGDPKGTRSEEARPDRPVQAVLYAAAREQARTAEPASTAAQPVVTGAEADGPEEEVTRRDARHGRRRPRAGVFV